jgi:BMFP domain-containing protein YqiC
MNQKIQKTINDIAKTKTKITELQAKLRDLEAQRIDMENTEIVGLFRSVDVAPRELADFIRAYKAQTRSAAPMDQTRQGALNNEE